MSAYDALIVLDRAVAHWPLDETTGSTAADVSGHGHDATLYNSPTMGVAGPVSGQSAMDFSATAGHNPYGVVALPAQLPTVPGSCTWECWVKIPASATDNSTPFSLANNSSSYTGYFVALQPGAPASIFVGRYGGSSSADDAGADTPTIMDGTWHHVVFTNAGAGGASALYLDGVPLALTFSDAFVTALAADAALLAGDAEGYDPAYSYEGRFTGALAHVALYDYALTACQVLSHYDLATTGTYTPCNPPDWLRLGHASGKSYIQQNGAQVQVVAGNVGVLDLPLPALAAPPARYVGIDVASGLPAVAPLPPPPINVAVPPTAPVPPPVAANQDVQMRCGTAQALTTHLLSLYQQWADELKPAVTVVGEVALVAFLVAFIDPMYDVAIAGAAAAGVYSVIRSLMLDVAGAAGGSAFLTPTADAQTAIRKACFCQLTVSAGVVQVTQTAIAAWRAALPPNLGEPGTLTQQLLDALLAYTPLQDWQTAAQGAVASPACDDWTCP